MSLIQNITMTGMLKQAQTMARAKIENSGYTVKTPWARSLPITSKDIDTLVKIEYAGKDYGPEPAGLTGWVYLTGNIPFQPFPGPRDKITAFSIKTERTGRDAYIDMFDLCNALARNIHQVLEDNKAVLQADNQLEITMKSGNDEYRVRVNDLMHRRNDWYKKNQDSNSLTKEPIPKAKILECLIAAKEKYQAILTERKIQRLNTLIAEANGTNPTYRQHQKLARETTNN